MRVVEAKQGWRIIEDIVLVLTVSHAHIMPCYVLGPVFPQHSYSGSYDYEFFDEPYLRVSDIFETHTASRYKQAPVLKREARIKALAILRSREPEVDLSLRTHRDPNQRKNTYSVRRLRLDTQLCLPSNLAALKAT